MKVAGVRGEHLDNYTHERQPPFTARKEERPGVGCVPVSSCVNWQQFAHHGGSERMHHRVI